MGPGRAAVGTVTGASVLRTSPEELRRAARQLRAIGTELESLGGKGSAVAGLDGSWRGLAALEQEERTRSVHSLVGLAAAPGRAVAQELDRCADVADDAGARVRSWTARAEDGVAELSMLRGQVPPPEPLLEAAWRRRLEEVEREIERARIRVGDAEADFDRAQQRAAEVIAGAWSVVEELARLGALGKDVRSAARRIPWAVVHTVRTSQMAISFARARFARSAAVRALALQRANAQLQALLAVMVGGGKGPTRVGMARFAPGPVGLILSWVAALSDVRSGGGYQGWRGGTTRVLAAGALVGGPLIVAGVVFPPLAPAAPVGVGLVGLYQAWSIGNAVWDGIPVMVRYARLAVRHAPLVARTGAQLTAVAGVRAAGRLRRLRDLAVVRGYQSAVDLGRRVDDVGEQIGRMVVRLPDSGRLRDRLREVGVPIRLPSTPLGPVLRAPVELGRLPVGARP